MRCKLTKFMFSILIFLLILTCSFKTFAMQIKDTTGYPNGIKVKTGTDVFGHNSVYKNKSYGKQKMIKEDNYKNSYFELDKYYYVIYKYDKILDGVVSYFGDYHKNEAGNKLIFTYTYTNSETLSYEETFKKTNSTSTGIELKSGIDAKVFETASTISTTISQSEEIGLNISKTYTNTLGYTLTYETSIKDYDTFYRFEKRALFDVYKVDIYELMYYKEEDACRTWYGKKYHKYTYYQNDAKLIDESYRFSYIEGSAYDGIIEYSLLSNGKYKRISKTNENFNYLE